MLTVNRKSLVSALTLVQRSAGAANRHSFPILACAVLEYKSAVLEVHATNLDTWARKLIPVENGQDTPAFCAVVPCAALLKAIRGFTGEYVALTRVHENGVAGWRLRVECEGAIALFDEQPHDEYPTSQPFEASESFTLPADVFAADLNRVLYASSMDETRYNLNSVHFESRGDASRWVATDGHRLATCEAPDLGASLMIPRVLLTQIAQGIGKHPTGAVVFQHDATKGSRGDGAGIRFEHGACAWSGRAVAGEYPNVDHVLAPPTGRGAEVDSAALLAVLRSAEAGIPPEGDSAAFVAFHFRAGEIEVRNTGDVLLSGARVKASVSASAEGLRIAFNVRYLRELVEHAGSGKLTLSVALDDRERDRDGSLALGIKSAKLPEDPAITSPMRVDFERVTAIVMPVKV